MAGIAYALKQLLEVRLIYIILFSDSAEIQTDEMQTGQENTNYNISRDLFIRQNF